MGWLQPSTFPLWINLTIFLLTAALIWGAGTRLAGYADVLSARTGLSQTFVGLLMLGVVTSLPEVATTITGSMIGNAALVSGNLFGGVALQVTVLAIVDIVAVRGALTYFSPQPALLFQGVMLLLLLSIALAGAVVSEPLVLFGVGMTPPLLLLGYVLTVWLSLDSDSRPKWRATDKPDPAKQRKKDSSNKIHLTSNVRLYSFAVLAGLVILTAGWALAQTADVLAEQTGLGATFVGVALVAGSTSLPELSTALGAVRRGNHEMAVSNILGTNCLELALFFLADLFYRRGAILGATDRSTLFAGILGMIVTCIFVVGLLERRNRTVFGMGVDSLLVLAAYFLGLGGIYYLR